MSPLLHIRDILERHSELYVLLDSCKFDDSGRVTHGAVVDASPEPDAVYERLRQLPTSVIVYAGPEDRELEGAFLDSGETWKRTV